MSLTPGRQFQSYDGMGPQPKPIGAPRPTPTPTPFKKLPDIPKKTYTGGVNFGGGTGTSFTTAVGGGVPGGLYGFGLNMT